jgi:hypothetical protein
LTICISFPTARYTVSGYHDRLSLPSELARLYDTLLERKAVAVEQRPHYKKWLRFYWDFCHKYAFEPTDRQNFAVFREKLRAKQQSESQCKQLID